MLPTSKPLPLDIKPAWLNIVRRLQSVARQPGGNQAVITIRVLVNEDGEPLKYTKPSVVVLEPRSVDILDVLAGDGE